MVSEDNYLPAIYECLFLHTFIYMHLLKSFKPLSRQCSSEPSHSSCLATLSLFTARLSSPPAFSADLMKVSTVTVCSSPWPVSEGSAILARWKELASSHHVIKSCKASTALLFQKFWPHAC